ncbi:MAG: hypoxanthine phosphoribosyltransferase [Acutalibacteraceae bacterium]|nr:hypoxanthine phosphoribosyltransferase [Acutalibacteraceae bacterium]
MNEDIKSVLLSEKQLDEITTVLGEKITADYKNKRVLAVGLLKGSFIFMADLIRKIDLPLEVDFMVASSYGAGTETSNMVEIKKDIRKDLSGYHVLIVEDIIDSGNTMSCVKKLLESRNAESVKLCTLLDKPARRQVEIEVDYTGQEIPDEFVVGYGLDYAEKYRNLPYLGILSPAVYGRK